MPRRPTGRSACGRPAGRISTRSWRLAYVATAAGRHAPATRLPFISFADDGCDFCNRCIEVCPTGALAGFDPATGKIGVARVQANRCLAYSGGCTLCLEKCPYGALTLDPAGRPVVDEGLCNGCGMCEAVCPALVYRSFAGGTRRGIVIEALPEGGSKQ